jgi:hypothetical protein
MAWPTPRFWTLCALDLAAVAGLAAVAYARLPAQQACILPQPEAPGFTTLAAPVSAPACLRFRLR